MENIDAKNILTFSFPSTEKIKSDYQLDFIRTNLQEEETLFDENSCFYFSYIEESSTYEVLLFEKCDSKVILEPFIFYSYEKSEINGVIAFLTDEYFTLYKDSEFLLFKYIKNVSKDDIEIYVSGTYKLKIDSFIYVDKNDLINLKEKSFNQKFTYFPYKKDDSYRYFKIYLISSFFIFSAFMFFTNINTKQNKNTVTTLPFHYHEKIKKLREIHKSQDDKLMFKIVDIFKYIKIHKIKLQQIEYKKDKTTLFLISKKKKNLLDLLTSYEKGIDVSYIEFNEAKGSFEMVVEVEL